MSTNIVNRSPFLRTSREFPEDMHQLTVEINKSYVDIANVVNDREIGLYPSSRPAMSGQRFYVQGNQPQQGFRQIYTFTSSSSIDHGINVSNIFGFTSIYGSFTDGTNWYPLPYVNSTAANQIGVRISSTQIVFIVGGSAPTITKGVIVLEWISNP